MRYTGPQQLVNRESQSSSTWGVWISKDGELKEEVITRIGFAKRHIRPRILSL